MVDEPYLTELRQLAEAVDIEFDLRREVSDEDLLQLYQTASLFLYAPRLEPFGLAPLEASACELWTVAVAEGGTRESVIDGQTGSLVVPDERAFGEKIDDLLADNAKLPALGRLARETVIRKWSMEAAVLRLDGLLQRVVNESGTGTMTAR
jgi:glycosyltransferase involved in cell wall biosynthesis